MRSLFYDLLELAIDNDPVHRETVRTTAKQAEQQYDRLCAAMGSTVASEIWDAALDVGSAGQELLFLNGLRMGIQFMALTFYDLIAPPRPDARAGPARR